MRRRKEQSYSSSKRVKIWLYVVVLLFNTACFLGIGSVYNQSAKEYNQKLFNENVNTVNSLNAASANAANTYTASMGIKADDSANYIRESNFSYTQAVAYLASSSTNPDRQLQLIRTGSYGPTGEISFGDYTGVSIRKTVKSDGMPETLITDIVYGSGYYDILKSFTDVNDENMHGLCFTPEFTDPDTKLKCFGVYRHLTLTDTDGQKKLYTLLLAIHSQTALDAYNMQNEYAGQSTVLINEYGDYIIKNTNYRNANFYDYIANYNGLSTEQKNQMRESVSATIGGDERTVALFYKNHRGDDCIFSVTAMQNNWHSITCVPIASFNLENNSVNFSKVMLLLFLLLFLVDALAIYYFGHTLNRNILVAKKAQEAANAANAAKSKFLSTMSHELRTPLNAIIGLTALSRDSIENVSALRNYLKKIDISSKLLLQLISDILDISAIESGKMRLNNTRFDMTRIITALSAIYYDQCALKDIDFSVVLKDMHAESLIGDAVRLNQILLNFLSNAVKFTPNGGQVTLSAEQVSREGNTVTVRFEVRDTGCGISDELRARLFKPFERAGGEAAKRYSGTGLGLSIAKSLTELMGGSIHVESQEGVGARFWVEIPFTVPEKATQHTFSPLTDMRVLVAVRNADERQYIGEILQSFSLEYMAVDNAADALTLLREGIQNEKPFDLCMLDWKLPDLNAMDAAVQMRAVSASVRMMVLAYDLVDAKAQCAEVGVDYVFCKPVFPSLLYNFLQEITTGIMQAVPDITQNYNLRGKRVLLVEDNQLNREIARLLLSKIHLEVEEAEDGERGCKRFKESEAGYFDAILMDIQMPVMNGYEATVAIRACDHPQAKTIPILAMTADAFAEDVERAQAAGMNDHLAKPIVPENLYLTLEKLIGMKK